MGMTITEKILAHAGGLAKVSPGDVAVVAVETACMITSPSCRKPGARC
jgi:hypothetical protein